MCRPSSPARTRRRSPSTGQSGCERSRRSSKSAAPVWLGSWSLPAGSAGRCGSPRRRAGDLDEEAPPRPDFLPPRRRFGCLRVGERVARRCRYREVEASRCPSWRGFSSFRAVGRQPPPAHQQGQPRRRQRTESRHRLHRTLRAREPREIADGRRSGRAQATDRPPALTPTRPPSAPRRPAASASRPPSSSDPPRGCGGRWCRPRTACRRRS